MLVLLLVLAVKLTPTDAVGVANQSLQSLRQADVTNSSKLQAIPLSFIENPGTTGGAPGRSRTAYFLQGRDASASFSREGVVLTLTDRTVKGERRTAVVQLAFPGSQSSFELRGQGRQSTRISYFSGRKRNWHSGLSTFDQVVYAGLWPGIDLVFSGNQQQLKYEFLVQPGADPGQIRLAYTGLEAPLKVDPEGRMEIATPVKILYDEKPVSFQDLGRRVETSFRLFGGSQGKPGTRPADRSELDRQVYGFRLGRYDRERLLVIDPAIRLHAGFIGGSGEEEGHGIAVDSVGRSYITGVTTSLPASFPDLVGPGTTLGGRSDAFVARVKADGSGLDYAGYIGGTGDEAGHSIAVDSTGNALIAGWTSSAESTFPVTVGPRLTYGGAIDGFVAKIDPTGSTLLYCGYLGGDDQDEALDIAVDSLGRAYLTGLTASGPTTFPVSVGPDLTFNGTVDAFVARVRADGSSLDYAGYLGGAGNDQGYGIAVDAANNAYLTGLTTSTQATFPVTGPLDPTFNGVVDAFVAKVNATGAALTYCGYLGGSGIDEGFDIAVDAVGQATLAGRTSSTEATFPVAIGPDLTANGLFDAFIARINSAGSAVVYAGFIGGSGDDQGRGLALDSAGNAYVVGRTTSDSDTFPESNGFDLTLSGTSDGFIALVVSDGRFLNYATYLGGAAEDEALAIAVKSFASAVVTGYSRSQEASFPVLTGPAVTHGGASDAFHLAVDADRFEADLWPRPGGNRTLTPEDWQQTGRFAVGLDTVTNSTEFQQADCAPRASLGDGKLDLLDWIQSGRYAVGADSILVSGGPTSPSVASLRETRGQKTRLLYAAQPVYDALSDGISVPFELVSLGGEHGLTFSIHFDPQVLQYIAVIPTLMEEREGAPLVNDRLAHQGQLGIGFALAPGKTFPTGINQILRVQFRMRYPLTSKIEVRNGLVPLALADDRANPLPISARGGTVDQTRSLARRAGPGRKTR
jgi:hypothetical protein